MRLRLFLASLLAGTELLFAVPLAAQVPQTPVGDQAAAAPADATPSLTVAGIEARWAAIEADTGVENAVKDVLRPKYKQAIDALKEAADLATKAAHYGDAIKSAPGDAEDLRAQLKALPSAETAAPVDAAGSSEELQKEVASRRAALSGLNDELSKVRTEASRVNERPAEISARGPEVQRELTAIRAQLASPEFAEDMTSPGRVADRLLLQARESKLQTESEMLKQEQLSQSVRRDLLQARQELLTRQVENSTAALKTLETVLQQRLKKEAEQVSSRAETTQQQVPQDDQEAQDLASEVQTLAQEFAAVVENSNQVSAARSKLTARLAQLTREYDSLSKQLELGGAGGEMAQVLFDLQQRLLRTTAYEARLTGRLPTLAATRLAELKIRAKIDGQTEKESQFADRSSPAVQQLVEARSEVLGKLQMQYGELIPELAALESDKRQLVAKANDVRTDISKQLFWMRSSPPFSSATLSEFPSGLRWALQGEHWVSFGQALWRGANRMPIASTVIVVLVMVLLLLRRRMTAVLERTGTKTRRISTDRYAHTGEALLWTVLIAAPAPLLIGFVAWTLTHTLEPSVWIRGLAAGLQQATWIMFVLEFMATVCRPGGLGTAHFRWQQEPLTRFRRVTFWVAVVYVPALLVTSSTLYGDALDSVARIVLMLAHALAAIVLWRLFNFSDGFLATLVREHPSRLVARSRYLWYPLVVTCPAALAVLAGLGYVITAYQLSLGLLATLTLVASGVILYCLTRRWFSIKYRKLALAEALDRRRARQAADDSDADQDTGEEVVSVEEDEEQLDLDSIGDQTLHLLRVLFGLGVAVAILSLWSGTLPLIPVFETITIPLTGGLTLLALAQAVLIVAITWIAMHNLPGLLELAILRATSIESGTRKAITKLCQYAVIAVGIFLVVNVLKVDWTKFGWIAAALSVGLGFGLQEVVANFVCGLILLFERPLRVGDIVTVEGMTGTVTKMQMRATTITNWDRHEFVVPNKTLITGTLENWTLSASINRVVIPVGVAYGSDTEKARQILLEVAADHPIVLEDPAPLASFEQFADSSLNLVLRAYLPDLDNRLGTITELHSEIDKRFAAAGIEISFPQRDLHLKNGWESTQSAGTQSATGEAEHSASYRANTSGTRLAQNPASGNQQHASPATPQSEVSR